MEAVNLCRTQDFDVIVMDIMMPKLDGFFAYKEIKKLKTILVLMLSACGEEYEFLFYLVKNKNVALTRDKLLSEVWGFDFYGDDRTIDTYIKMLRNSLGAYRDYIVTLRGLGYKFEYIEQIECGE